jgi:ribonucleoside-diphosphate reductase alpha chain
VEGGGAVIEERPEAAYGVTRKVITGCGSLYVTLNSKDGKLFEVFTSLGKSGGCAAAQCEAIGRMVSLALRGGIEVGEIVKHLVGISCHAPAGFGPNKILSCSDAVAKALQQHEAEKVNP